MFLVGKDDLDELIFNSVL